MHNVSPLPPVHAALSLPLVDLASHRGSAQVFHESCLSEMQLRDHFSQWTEWLDGLLARRFATSLLLVGGLAAFIALVA